MKPIVILGAGGHARVTADVCRAAGRSLKGFLDPAGVRGVVIDDIPVLGDDSLLSDSSFATQHAFINGVASREPRPALSRALDTSGVELATLVHPSAVVSARAELGGGVLIVGGAVVNTGAIIGRHAVINTGATVDHDCWLAEGVQVGPGAHLGGNVRCEANVFIGLGALVLQGIKIGAAAIVGAGAVVLRDVPAGETVAGNPARPLRNHAS